jgi:hypothetical protein
MILDSYSTRNPAALIRMMATAVPWQYLYHRTSGGGNLKKGPAHWAILSSSVESFDPVTFAPQEMNILQDAVGSTWADPFCRSHGDNNYLFIEEWPPDTPNAHLSMMELDSSGLPTGPTQPIIRSANHYSYPCIFEYDNTLWMLPENSTSNRLQLYRCNEFPFHWVADKVLMQGVQYADPTVFQHDGHWWMFITLRTGYFGLNTNLFLFHTDNPIEGEWRPHPMNPVVSGLHHARPAGRPFYANGRFFRPSQNSLKCYGHGLRINEIVTLNTHQYRESFVREILPWADNILGVHHMDVCGKMVMMDVRLRSSETTRV